MKYPKIKISNPWKAAFLILLGLIFIIYLVLMLKITRTLEIEEASENVSVLQDEPAFLVQLTKKQANQMIQSYLKNYQDNSEMKYEFTLDDEVELTVAFKIFGFELEAYLRFEPEMLENGVVSLKATDMAVGTLSLPISEVMKLFVDNIELPPWTKLDATNQTINLYMDQFVLENGMHFRVKEINLQDDRIQIDVFIPETM